MFILTQHISKSMVKCSPSQEEEIEKVRELSEQNQKLKEENEQYKQVKPLLKTQFTLKSIWSVKTMKSLNIHPVFLGLISTEVTTGPADKYKEGPVHFERVTRYIFWIRSP